MKQIPLGMTPEQIRELVGDSPLMLEIGCHDGWPPLSHTRLFLEAMPGIRLHCFEPDARAIADFRKHFNGDPRVTLYEAAVADVDGPKPFYASTGRAGSLADWNASGSTHQPTGHLKRSREIRFMPPVPVPCVRLDSWLAAHPEIEKMDFAWVDVQGSQVDLLAGARETLPRIHYFYIECHKQPQYEGEPTQAELIAMLPDFTPLAIYGGENILFRNEREVQ